MIQMAIVQLISCDKKLPSDFSMQLRHQYSDKSKKYDSLVLWINAVSKWCNIKLNIASQKLFCS